MLPPTDDPAVNLVPSFLVLTGCDFILDLICADIAKNAFSTFVAFFAEVSINSIPKESANSFPCSKVTARLEVKSDLFPTRSLLTFSLA